MLTAQVERRELAANYRNLLLRSLSPGDSRLLRSHLHRVSLRAGDVVGTAGTGIDRILFPESIIASLVDGASGNQPDVGMIGYEGMIGWWPLLGCTRSPLKAIVRIGSGTALAIDAKLLVKICQLSSTLHASLLRYVHSFTVQMAATVGSSSDTMERRVARWLLMIHDRSEGDLLALTHDHIGSALNVRRASVTDCLHMLEGAGVLKCTRGKTLIRDRRSLELAAGSAYGAMERHFSEEIFQFGKGTGQVSRLPQSVSEFR
jgi:CRP-like cAMP-binding protein